MSNELELGQTEERKLNKEPKDNEACARVLIRGTEKRRRI